jgi:hypothetical protein
MVGNNIQGGRQVLLGSYFAQTSADPLYSIHICGNTALLAPPVDGGPYADWPSVFVVAGNLRRALVAGNTLGKGDYGFWAALNHVSAEFLKNDFRNASQFSIIYQRPAGSTESVLIAKCLLSCGQYVAPPVDGWIYSVGSGIHVRVPYEDASKFFLFGNSYVDINGNPTGLVLDPPQAPVNLGP